MTEDYVNGELDDMNKHVLNNENKIRLDEEEREKETKTITEDVIHSNVNENYTGPNWNNLKEVIYEYPDDISPVAMDYSVKD